MRLIVYIRAAFRKTPNRTGKFHPRAEIYFGAHALGIISETAKFQKYPPLSAINFGENVFLNKFGNEEISKKRGKFDNSEKTG